MDSSVCIIVWRKPAAGCQSFLGFDQKINSFFQPTVLCERITGFTWIGKDFAKIACKQLQQAKKVELLTIAVRRGGDTGTKVVCRREN